MTAFKPSWMVIQIICVSEEEDVTLVFGAAYKGNKNEGVSMLILIYFFVVKKNCNVVIYDKAQTFTGNSPILVVEL